MLKRTIDKFRSDDADLKTERTLLAIIFSFVIGLVLALINGMDLASALWGAFVFSLLTGAVVAVLAWAVDTAKQKGYPGLLGFLAVLFLNVFGILLLLLLPRKKNAGGTSD